MVSIYISLHDDDGAPNVQVLKLDRTGEAFMNIRVANGCTVTLPGYDHIAVIQALALAEAIRAAAESLKDSLLADEASKPAAEEVAS
jgi:hypothetical protein